MKVALYARYSSDNQREASIADQFRVCLTSAEKQGWRVVEEYSDHRCVASASRCSSAHHRRGQFSSESNHYVNEKPPRRPPDRTIYSDVRFRLPIMSVLFCSRSDRSARTITKRRRPMVVVAS